MDPLFHSSAPAFRLGFLPLADSAPLLVAKARGFFDAHGVSVQLCCEIGWATVREKLAYGELDGASAVAGLAPVVRLGLHSPACPVIVPLVLSLQGNAITLSRNLYNSGVRDPASLCALVRGHQNRVLTFGVISRWSSHYFLLREWLASGGLNVDEDVRLVILPPPLMPRLLASGVIDGFCSGEPWNSAAVIDGTGWVPVTTGELSPLHVEKVLLLNENVARANVDATRRLLTAIREACAWCEEKSNRPAVAEILFESGHFNTSLEALRASLVGPFQDGTNTVRETGDFFNFHRHDANTPTSDRALWLLRGLRRHAVITAAQETELQDALVASWGVMSHLGTTPPPVAAAAAVVAPEAKVKTPAAAEPRKKAKPAAKALV